MRVSLRFVWYFSCLGLGPGSGGFLGIDTSGRWFWRVGGRVP